MKGTERRERALAAAHETGGVLSRDALAGLGLTGDDVRHEVAAGRWRRHGLQTVAVHNGELSVEAQRWRAVWETGPCVTALDGVTALQVAGLRNYADEEVHVSVIHRCAVKHVAGTRLHKIIRRLPDELVGAGVPRTRPAVAALRAAYWATSDRQAALVLLLTVQQRLTTPQQLLECSTRLRGRARRGFVGRVLLDIAGGVQSLGELDFARMCRVRGLPEPARQVVRQGPRGRTYLDVRWDCCALVVEIDGAQHREGLQVSADNLSRNALALHGETVLRIDLIGLRLHEDAFLEQVAAGLKQPIRRRSR